MRRVGREEEACLGLPLALRQIRNMAPDRRPVLETVPAAAADEQHLAPLWMAIDDQIAIVAILILADARFGELADFVVPSKDIFSIDPQTIATVKVLRTVVGGKDAYVAE